MAAPKYDDLLEPLFEAMHQLGGSASIEEQEERVASIMNLTDEDLSEIHRGEKTKFSYRLAWARTCLKRYGVSDRQLEEGHMVTDCEGAGGRIRKPG